MTDLVKIDPFNNVAASSLAVTKYRPPSQQSSLFGIILQLGGTAFNESHINSIRVKAPGGKDLLTTSLSGARLRDLWEYEGGTWDTARAFVPIMFGDPFALTKSGRHIGNFDHSVYQGDMTIEVDIGAATAPTLSAVALVDPPKALMGLGYEAGEILRHRALIETVLTPSAAVTNQAQQIGIGSAAGALLRRVAFFHANMTAIRVKKEGLIVFEDVSAALNNYIGENIFARLPQSGLFVYDRIVDGSQRESGTTVQRDGRVFNWQFELTTSGADTIRAWSDVFIALPQL